MADEFKIVASLDVPKSVQEINKDIPKLQGQSKHLKIIADLDPKLSIKNIQATLNKMNNNANIKIGIDTSGLNSTLNDVQNKIVATNNGLSIKPTVDGKVIEDTDVLIKTVVSKLQTLNTVDLKAFKDNLKNILGVSSKEISADADTLIQTLKLNPEDTNLIIQSYENLMDSIRNTMSSMGKDKIVSGSSFDNNLVTSIYKAATSFKETQVQALQTADNIANKTDSDMAKMEEQIRETTTAIKEQTKATKELKAVRDSITRDADNKQISRTSVYEDKGFTRTEYRDENDKLTAYTDTTNYEKISKELAKANVEATKLQTRLDSIQSKYEDVNASKSIKDDSHLQQLGNQYNVVQQAIENVRTADSNTMAQMKANADAEIKKLEDLTRQFRNAEYAANALRERDITTVKNTETNDLNKFIAQINSAKIPVQSIKNDIDGLKTALANVTDKESLTAYLNQFDVVKSKFDSIKVTYNSITSAIKDLNALQNSTTFNKNISNPRVTQTKQEIAQLLAEYQKLMTQMQGNITPEGLIDIGNQLTQLNARLNTATATAKQFESELKNDNGAEKLAQRVALLKAQLTALAKANPKALKRFGDEINSLMATLNNSPDTRAIERVTKDIQLLRREINNANLAGKTLWQTLKEKAGKFVGWMSLTGIISSIWREMQQMVTNVVEIDKAMTNLKKVTDETDTTYARFLKNANQQAKELHSTVTDLVEQVATWSKLGYSLSESQNLAKTSMIYSNVGEVDNTTAVSDLVTVMKAFNIESEKSIRIVDSLNELGKFIAPIYKNIYCKNSYIG